MFIHIQFWVGPNMNITSCMCIYFVYIHRHFGSPYTRSHIHIRSYTKLYSYWVYVYTQSILGRTQFEYNIYYMLLIYILYYIYIIIIIYYSLYTHAHFGPFAERYNCIAMSGYCYIMSSVCLSVSLSVCRLQVYSDKMTATKITQFLLISS